MTITFHGRSELHPNRTVQRHGYFPETGEALQDLAEDVHMWLAYGMLAVAAGHVAAAFKHRWFDGHDVIRRMTFGGR